MNPASSNTKFWDEAFVELLTRQYPICRRTLAWLLGVTVECLRSDYVVVPRKMPAVMDAVEVNSPLEDVLVVTENVVTGVVYLEVQTASLSNMAERMLIQGLSVSRQEGTFLRALPIQRLVRLRPQKSRRPNTLRLTLVSPEGDSEFSYKVPVRYLDEDCHDTLLYPLFSMYTFMSDISVVQRALVKTAAAIPDDSDSQLYLESMQEGINLKFGRELNISPEWTEWDGFTLGPEERGWKKGMQEGKQRGIQLVQEATTKAAEMLDAGYSREEIERTTGIDVVNHPVLNYIYRAKNQFAKDVNLLTLD